MKKRRYHLRGIGEVNVTSSSHSSVRVHFDWNGGRRHGWYDVSGGFLIMDPSRRDRQSTIVNKYPQYLKDEICLAVYRDLMAGKLTFFEYNRDEERRYINLRYHFYASYYGFCLQITRLAELADPAAVTRIFNENVSEGDVLWTTSADGDKAVTIRKWPATHEERFSPRVYVRRPDGSGDSWLLKFLAPMFVEPQHQSSKIANVEDDLHAES